MISYVLICLGIGFLFGAWASSFFITESLMNANKSDSAIFINGGFYYVVKETRYLALLKIELLESETRREKNG